VALPVLDRIDLVEEGEEVEVEVQQHQQAEQDGAAHEENGLHDLNPGRGHHAASDDVDHHQRADECDRWVELGPEEGPVEIWAQVLVQVGQEDLDQASGPDHLSHHVRRTHGDGGEGRRRTHRHRRHPVGEDVGHRVLAGVAHGLGDQEEHGQVCDQPAHGVHEAVVAVERDQAGDAQE